MIRGEYTYENGKLNLTTHTNNKTDFQEALAAMVALRDECQRQIDNKHNCPFYKKAEKMTSIKEILKVPSAALQAMVDGLRKQSQRQDFKVDMSTFGYYDFETETCFGCAATCAVQEAFGVTFDKESIDFLVYRAEAVKCDARDLDKFESAIDCARQGDLRYLFRFFGAEYSAEFDHRFELYSDNWKEQLPFVDELIVELKQKGL